MTLMTEALEGGCEGRSHQNPQFYWLHAQRSLADASQTSPYQPSSLVAWWGGG